eukprot:jgi/Phyca11/510300/fgenesh2_kg.PHYCAscaffold_58_\
MLAVGVLTGRRTRWSCLLSLWGLAKSIASNATHVAATSAANIVPRHCVRSATGALRHQLESEVVAMLLFVWRQH